MRHGVPWGPGRPRGRFGWGASLAGPGGPGGGHSLVELGGPAQGIAHVRGQVPGVLRRVPAQLLALGVVHVPHVVEGPRLPDLRAAPRLGRLPPQPPGSPGLGLRGGRSPRGVLAKPVVWIWGKSRDPSSLSLLVCVGKHRHLRHRVRDRSQSGAVRCPAAGRTEAAVHGGHFADVCGHASFQGRVTVSLGPGRSDGVLADSGGGR